MKPRLEEEYPILTCVKLCHFKPFQYETIADRTRGIIVLVGLWTNWLAKNR